MIVIPLALLFLFGAPQQATTPAGPTSQQNLEQAKSKYEAYRQAAIHINDLAGKIHSEVDARAFIDAVAEQLAKHRYQYWTAIGIRHRVARAEYAAVADASGLIPEQRIVDVWSEYTPEIDAPVEALTTVAEVHNLRDGLNYTGQTMWERQLNQSLWTMPNVAAIDADGRIAGGCRALEALKIIYNMHELFQNLLSARERVQKGVLASDLAAQRQGQAPAPQAKIVGRLRAVADQNPVRLAAMRYQQERGEGAYRNLLKRLFDELFPKE
jgi:hypothetical protein